MTDGETGKMIKGYDFLLWSAKDLQDMGMSKRMAHHLLNRTDVPVVKIGERKFVWGDKFMLWVESQILTTQGEIVDEPEETEEDTESTVK